jgi:hypothetical protein
VVLPQLDKLPFLQSVCWQGEVSSMTELTEAEVLQLYERNWRYRGVLADLSQVEACFVRKLSAKYHSWLANDL